METSEYKTWFVIGEPFKLPSRYQVLDHFGSGTFGVVCAAEDRRTKEIVAIKKCKNVFQSVTMAKRTLREIRLLRLLKHEHIIDLMTLIKPENLDNFTDIYSVFEILETDLAQIIHSPQMLQPAHVQYFTFQLVNGLNFLHSARVVHRDIKPRNLFVGKDCNLKIGDFGLARVLPTCAPITSAEMTDYVTTRWYRAPEVIVGWSDYSTAVDMWSVGCIMAELILRRPLFPGSNSSEQLQLIVNRLKFPSPEFLQKVRKSEMRAVLDTLHAAEVSPIDGDPAFATTDQLCMNLMTILLMWDPAERMKADAALMHPFLRPMKTAWEFERGAMERRLRQPIGPLTETMPDFVFEKKTSLTSQDVRLEFVREFEQYPAETPADVDLPQWGTGDVPNPAPAAVDSDVPVDAAANVFTRNSERVEGPPSQATTPLTPPGRH